MLKQYAKSYTGRSMVLNVEAAEDDNTVVTDASGTFATTVSPDIIGAAEYDVVQPVRLEGSCPVGRPSEEHG